MNFNPREKKVNPIEKTPNGVRKNAHRINTGAKVIYSPRNYQKNRQKNKYPGSTR